MKVLCLNSKRTHDKNPECPQRLVPEPDRDHWYCLDCGLSIIQEYVEVTLVKSVGSEITHMTPAQSSQKDDALMPYVDCPVCGAPKAAYEDSETTTFCGKCEEKYQEAEQEREEREETEHDD